MYVIKSRVFIENWWWVSQGCICVYLYMYQYVYIYICIYVHIWCIYTYIYVCIQMYGYVYMSIHMVYIHAMCIHINMYIYFIYTLFNVKTKISAGLRLKSMCMPSLGWVVCLQRALWSLHIFTNQISKITDCEGPSQILVWIKSESGIIWKLWGNDFFLSKTEIRSDCHGIGHGIFLHQVDREKPLPGVFFVEWFPDQAPWVRDFTMRCDGRRDATVASRREIFYTRLLIREPGDHSTKKLPRGDGFLRPKLPGSSNVFNKWRWGHFWGGRRWILILIEIARNILIARP